MPAPDFLTSGQVADRLKVSRSTVIRLVNAGRFPGSIQVGIGQHRRRGVRIPETAVTTYLTAAAYPPEES